MPVHTEQPGHRSVQVEVIVPGPAAEAWRAIATGPGIGSWFVPTTFEYDAEDRPTRVISDFGPGMESISTVTEWNPPHHFAADSADLGPDAPSITTDWTVEPRDDGSCTVGVRHSIATEAADWDDQLAAWEGGWPDFFRILTLYLSHFPGQACWPLQFQAMTSLPRATAWEQLTEALGLVGVAAGDQRRLAAGAAPLDAEVVVERVGEAAHPEELLLRLEEPTPGIAHVFAMNMAGKILLSLRFYLYGEGAEAAAQGQEPQWSGWLAGLFPTEDAGSEEPGPS